MPLHLGISVPKDDTVYQLVYFPYLGLTRREEIRFGDLTVWDASLLPEKTDADPLQERIKALLESHRAPAGRPERSSPLRGIGVVSRGSPDFDQLVPARMDEIQDLRYALFLSCLSENLGMHGPNAGHDMYTAENFSFISQSFTLSSPYISETTGVIVRFTHLGYRIGEVQFPTPTHIPRPNHLNCDKKLLRALKLTSERDKLVYRQIRDATALFIESWHNTHSVDVRARVLLQAAAFEILLNLPASQQRKVFKDEIERICSDESERRYSYKYEAGRGKKQESRTRKGIWADRFYTLRNHIIHGEGIRPSEYFFRGCQHHMLIAPIFFVYIVKRHLEQVFDRAGEELRFYDHLCWHKPPESAEDDEDDEQEGFRTRIDLQPLLADLLAAVGD